MKSLSNNNNDLLTFINEALYISNNKIKVIDNNYIELINIKMIINDDIKFNEGILINQVKNITDNQYNLMKLDLLRILKNHKRNIKKLILNPKKFINKPYLLGLVYIFIVSLIVDIEQNYDYISSFTQLIINIFRYYDETERDTYNDDIIDEFKDIQIYKFYFKYKQLKNKLYKLYFKSNDDAQSASSSFNKIKTSENKQNIKDILKNKNILTKEDYKDILTKFNDLNEKSKEIIKKYLKIKQIYLMFNDDDKLKDKIKDFKNNF